MKKTILLLFAVSVLAVGCGNKEVPDKNAVDPNISLEMGNTDNDSGIANSDISLVIGDEEVSLNINDTENDEKVEVYFPKAAFNDVSDEQIHNAAKEVNATATINENGSVIYTMSKSAQTKLLEDTKEELNENIDSVVSKGKYPFIKEITLSEDYSEFNVTIDEDRYTEKPENFSYEVLVNKCLGCQTLSGVKPENLVVVVSEISEKDGTVLSQEHFVGE